MVVAKKKPVKSSGPQHLDLPTREWGQDRLQAYAVEVNQQIDEAERQTASKYWSFGSALTPLKKELGHGQFERFLKSQRIDKTRALKARKIFEAFKSAAELKDLTVEEAYAKRKGKQEETTKARPKSKLVGAVAAKGAEPTPPTGLPAYLSDVTVRTKQYIAEVAASKPVEVKPLLDQIAAAIEQLRRLRQALEAPPKEDDVEKPAAS